MTPNSISVLYVTTVVDWANEDNRVGRMSQKENWSKDLGRKIQVELWGKGYNVQTFLGSQGHEEAAQRPLIPRHGLGWFFELFPGDLSDYPTFWKTSDNNSYWALMFFTDSVIHPSGYFKPYFTEDKTEP